MMMQKMKQKQHDLIEKKIEHAKDEKMDVDQTSQAEVSNQSMKITCAACQELCDLQDYWKKPFV
jgi:succinate dehydrogenase/fumarate reductase-like Fe-S protein